MLFLNNFWKGETMSKAQIVADTYSEMRAKNASSQACYDAALRAAEYHGGIEIYNTNDRLTYGISSTPNRIFEFDDGSSVNVTYGGDYILTEEDLDDES